MKTSYQKLLSLLRRQKPEKSNAIIWLQGDRHLRGRKVLDLYLAGYAKIIVISGNDVLIGPKIRPGENNISLSEMKNYLVDNAVDSKDIVVDNKSYNTKDQAYRLTKLAKRRRWNRMILVSSSYNLPRAFLSFVKAIRRLSYRCYIICQGAKVCKKNMVASGRSVEEQELVESEIYKIKRYQRVGDIASYRDGFRYLGFSGIENSMFKFRCATLKDAKLLLAWRNDPKTRSASFNSRIIGTRAHNKWLRNSLKNDARKIYLVIVGKDPVGTIRTDTVGNTTILSWTVSPDFRGMGIGKKMVSIFAKKIYGRIQAEIKSDNHLSIRIAEYSGLKLKSKKKNSLLFERSAIRI